MAQALAFKILGNFPSVRGGKAEVGRPIPSNSLQGTGLNYSTAMDQKWRQRGSLSHRDPRPGVPGCQHILKLYLARKISKALVNTLGFFPGVC